MMINFRRITEDNFDAIIKMKRPAGENFVAPNAVPLAQAGSIEKMVMCSRLRYMRMIPLLDSCSWKKIWMSSVWTYGVSCCPLKTKAKAMVQRPLS